MEKSLSARAATRRGLRLRSPIGTGSSPARPAPARPCRCKSWRKAFRAPAFRYSPPTSRAIFPASPPAARQSQISSSARRIWASTTQPDEFPVVFWDLFGRAGPSDPRHRCSRWGRSWSRACSNSTTCRKASSTSPSVIADDDPELKAADGTGLVDLKDLRELLSYLSKNAKEVSARYGNVAVTAVGAVQRQLLVLENQGGTKFFGEPALTSPT